MTLVTVSGMTAPQYSWKGMATRVSYMSQLVALFSGIEDVRVVPARSAAEVDDNSSLILVGLNSLMSLSSNNVYGALEIVERYWDDSRLAFFIDAPVPDNIEGSVSSVIRDPERLFKKLFQKRASWPVTGEHKVLLLNAVEHLYQEEWPTTFYPELPWEYVEDVREKLPNAPLVSLNLDSVFPGRFMGEAPAHKLDLWTTTNIKNPWLLRQMHAMNHGSVSLRPTRFAPDSATSTRIASSTGFILPVEKDGLTWWNPHIMTSFHNGIPVVSNWKKTQKLGPEWALLPGAVEDMSVEERTATSTAQKESYLAALLTPTESVRIVRRAMDGEKHA